MKLLIVMPVCANDGPLAERLCDHIYKLHGKKQIGHLLIVANPDLHQELRARIRITAELAFESVSETIAPTLTKELASNKVRQMNNLFRHAAITVQTKFRWAWLWLEPDCVPLKPDWIAQLADAYDVQPRRYLGLVSKNANDKTIMARCGVYHPGASHELDKLCQGDAPFATAGAEKIVESATNTPLVAYLPIEAMEDLAKIPAKAVICHGDKQGIFAENWEVPFKPEIQTMIVNDGEFQPPAFVPGIKPQEVAKEIREFLASNPVAPEVYNDPVVIAAVATITDEANRNAPRQTRRSKSEALDKKHKLDCVATNGCKSSTPAISP